LLAHRLASPIAANTAATSATPGIAPIASARNMFDFPKEVIILGQELAVSNELSADCFKLYKYAFSNRYKGKIYSYWR
jgi:hypothetical protein